MTLKRKNLLPILIFSPLYIFFILHGKSIMRKEVSAWMKVLSIDDLGSLFLNGIDLLCSLPEFRFLLYYRYKIHKFNPIRLVYPPQIMSMSCKDVGEGLVIQHGFGTRIGCTHLGKNCQIWQGVTIGKARSGKNEPRPVIGDNVKICAGAMVLGGVTIGNNVTIGAATIVLKSVPDGCTVVGNPGKIVKRQ